MLRRANGTNGREAGGVRFLPVLILPLLLAAATVRAQRPGPISNLLRFAGYRGVESARANLSGIRFRTGESSPSVTRLP